MLSREDNEFLIQIGRGTPMGEFVRAYWLPLLLSSDLQSDGRPMRIRLLGESLVTFRDSNGRIGLLSEKCPHRGASLAFGRNEACGLRCVYHGWKFDIEGNSVELANEPDQRAASRNVKTTAYPCVERNGIVWTYLGLRAPPALPDIEWGLVPSAHRYVSRRVLECNWAQALEGDIDTSHASFLHRRLDARDYDKFDRARIMRYMDQDGHPVFEVEDKPYGLLVAARRQAEADSYYWRVSQFLFPIITMPASYEDMPYRSNVWLPMDDRQTLVWTVDWHPSRPLTAAELALRQAGTIGHCVEFLPASTEPGGRWRPRANRSNEYLYDEMVQRTEHFSGIREVWAQDKAASESMGEILDRTQEHLGTSDKAIVRWRRLMMTAAQAYAEGKPAPGLGPGEQLIRSASLVLPRDAVWQKPIAFFTRAGLDVPIPFDTV